MRDFESEKRTAAREAVKFLKDGMIVGLGSGSSSTLAIREIGELVKNGLSIKGIPTSDKTKELAESLGIPLIDIHTVDAIDITIDGADEFTTELMLIKGGGGALLKEKIVASLSREEIIIADSSKKVAFLGKFKLPVEVIPFASAYVLGALAKLGGTGEIRKDSAGYYRTDEGNYIIDADFGLIEDPASLAGKLDHITGVVEHGLFIQLASKVIMGDGEGVMVYG
ncbi:Ribose-5-phosphate isomerase A [Dyadobacter sp. CECT 9275]|uniref:Ribose-5-phosphate isomerase A n=1 Tax=Dyadobacter helix TaxID=2822344 RepID=A0A916JBW2_9BACT|nr:ribose-5-phosphate isomerase RpiA [Dyadobacter sp. CECT 9275]CAG5000541.1 Ribose-5-phosphate isomerase A [Dyadobacter sp. CECT 9275]